MAANNNDSNQLLKFVNTASTNIQARMQEALNKQGKGKKVNHRKYIQKRLQNNKPRKATKLATATTHVTAQVGRQPIASFPATISVGDCERLFQYVPQPLVNTRQPSQEQYDPEIDSILSEMGVYPDLSMDSPSQSSLYSDSTDDICRTSSTLSNNSTGSTSSVHHVPSSVDCYAFSPNSDFSYSDLDDSAYSSPRNASPICGYSPSSTLYYQQQQQPQTWCSGGQSTLAYDETSLMLDLYEYTS